MFEGIYHVLTLMFKFISGQSWSRLRKRQKLYFGWFLLLTIYIIMMEARLTVNILPRLRTMFAERGFSYAGPAAWNRLPESIRRTSSQAAFKRQLKTFLFCDAFNIVVYEHL